MPTPVVSDVWADGYERAITKESPNRGVGLPTWANRMKLLRTPTAAEVDGGPVHPDVAKAKGQTLRLTGQVLAKENWGDFTLAIERWEKLTGRPAPEPTLPDGQKGQERLSAKFTEWLMGLPDGWITGHGLRITTCVECCKVIYRKSLELPADRLHSWCVGNAYEDAVF